MMIPIVVLLSWTLLIPVTLHSNNNLQHFIKGVSVSFFHIITHRLELGQPS